MAGKFDVLVVDDDPVVLGGVKKILTAEGYTLDVAGDGETCLLKTKRNRYGLVLCDLMLPRIRGFDVAEILGDQLPGVPVVLITGYATLENAITGFRKGVFDFIPKPFDVGELLGVVRRGLAFAENRRTARSLDDWLCAAHSFDGGPARAYKLGGHAWVIVDAGGHARIGMGETFAGLAGGHEVELPARDDELLQGNRCARLIATGGWVHRLWAPVSGKVVETNDRVADELALLSDDEICKTWLITMMPSDLQHDLPQLTPVQPGPKDATRVAQR